MVVDDEPKVAFFFQKHLEMGGQGYEVKAVNSGQAALRELQASRYDLLITDLRMPQMDGLELLRRVRATSPQTKSILVTAYGTDDVWAEANRLDTFRSLSKPLKIPELLTAVREALTQPQKGQIKKERSELLILTGDHFELLAERIEELRVDVGARVVVLADTGGHMLAYTGTAEELNISSMMALLGGTMAASEELACQLKYQQPMHMSYFEGPPYDLYAANISYNLFLTIVYDRRANVNAVSRIGLVWLYMRRALADLRDMLGRQTEEAVPSLADGFAQSVQGELDNLFGTDAKIAATFRSSKPVPQPEPALNYLGSKINEMLARFGEQTNLAVESQLEALQISLPQPMVRLILQAVGQGLRNVHQHSQASIVGVSFVVNGRFLQGRIADNGIGFTESSPPAARSLAALQKEFEQAGGTLTFNGRSHYGVTLSFQLPISA